jgi:hypothetical protein
MEKRSTATPLHAPDARPNALAHRITALERVFFGIYADLMPEMGEKPHKKTIACCIAGQLILKCRAAYIYT